MVTFLAGFKKQVGARSLLIAALFCVAQCITQPLSAKSSCPISITTIAESSPGCGDGAIVVNTTPSGQQVCVTICPGDLKFVETTPATIRPAGTPGFPAGKYLVKVVTNNFYVPCKRFKLKKCVTIPVATYSVTVPPVTDAHCACNGAFQTIFNNPDNADVKVSFLATSGGIVIGTTGVYKNLCPGTYEWTVQATSKSAACNHKVVFKQSGVVVIGGSGPVETPVVTPTTQTVPVGDPIVFFTTPADVPGATYQLFQESPTGPILRQTNSTGNFEITAALTDAGTYFVTLKVDDCPLATSVPVTVVVSSSTCPLSMGLTPLPACSPSTVGSIEVTYSGSTTGTVDLYVNGTFHATVTTSPYIVSPLNAPATYTIKLVDTFSSVPNCFVQSSVFLPVVTPPTPVLTPSAACANRSFTMTVTPAGQQAYTLTLPNGTQLTQGPNENVFTFTDATAANDDGPYTATYVDSNGCTSGPSNTVTISVQPVPHVTLTPAVEGVPAGGTIFFTVSPFIPGATYALHTPNTHRGDDGIITQVGDPDFALQSAGTDDVGNYFATIMTAAGCLSDASAPPSSLVISGTCDLSIGLTPVPACSPNAKGSIILQFGGSIQTVNVKVNGTPIGQVSQSQTPFTIGNLSPNSYTVEITGVGAPECVNSATVDVTVSPPVTPVLTASSACSGSPLTMTVTPSTGISYTLTKVGGASVTQPGNVFTVAQSASSLNNGSYFANFIDQNGCPQGPSNTVNVTVQPTPLVTLTPAFQTTPAGGSASFTVTTNVTGNITYELTDPLGNTFKNTTGIFVVDPAIAGNYTAVVSANGCPSVLSAPVVVQVGGCLPFSVTPTPACATSTGSLIVNVSDHPAPYFYSVNGGPITKVQTSPFTISNLAVNASYTITVTDSSVPVPCSGTVGPIFIPLLPTPPQATLAPSTQTLAIGGTLRFVAGPTGVGSNCVFVMTVPNKQRGLGGVITQTSPIFLLTGASQADLGTYSVVLNCGGCPSDPSVPVSVVPPTCNLSITSVSPTSSCGTPNPGTGTLTIVTNGGGTPPYFYSADGVTFNGPTTDTTAVIQNLPPGTYNNITVKDSSLPTPCVAVGPSTVVAAVPAPPLTVSGTANVPLGGQIVLQATTTAASVSWTGPANFSAQGFTVTRGPAAADFAGAYIATAPAAAAASAALGADPVPCSSQAVFFVNVGFVPVLALTNSSNKKLCQGSCTSFTVTVQNTGASTATNLVLTDMFPSCIQILSAQATTGAWTIRTSGSGMRATLPSLAPGQFATITLNVKSNCSGGKTLESVATLVSDTTPSMTAIATITTACCPNQRCR